MKCTSIHQSIDISVLFELLETSNQSKQPSSEDWSSTGSEPAVGIDRDWFGELGVCRQRCMQDSLELTLAFDVVILIPLAISAFTSDRESQHD